MTIYNSKSRIWESRDKTVTKEVLKPGTFSRKPTERSECHIYINSVEVTGTPAINLKNELQSEILESNEKTIIIGDANSEIDRKIERGIQMMMLGEESLFTIRVSPLSNENEDIVKCTIKLNNFKPFKAIWDWTPEEKYEIALKYKETGVCLYKELRYVEAFHKFSQACKILITLEPIPDLELDKSLENNINTLRIILYNNLAGCHLVRENFEHAVKLCDKVLEKDENNVKALYRRGVAYGKLRNIEKAVPDLKKVITLEPHNAAAKEQFLIYNKKLQEANQRSKDMVKRMFKAQLG
ncbi:hypothetical protein KPH14_008976 [Odynerus spinipes]|uniref:BDBT FKBP like N-terminal domain-containing protein n=1 Tax=Odynerus spinipes TaxID=1348599 RepID=A0AAD9RNC5_9HYME|nr:hypothetical protein KPH14_008976 [Odynerus spinipes]